MADLETSPRDESANTVVFDRAASFYDETRGFPPGVDETVATGLSGQLGLTTQSQVLEIGVGTGRIALPLRPHVGSYVGIDLSMPMMEVLRQKPESESIALVQGDVTTLPFAAASFDLALAIHVFHLVGGWRDAVRELGRVVRPHGAVLINAYEGPDEIVQRWYDFLAAHGVAETARTVGERDMAVIGAAFGAEGFTRRENGVAAEWPSESRPSETIDALTNRVWSSTWDIPEPAFSRAISDLRDWLDDTYPDPDEPVTETSRFSYVLFRRPQDSRTW